MRCVPFGADRGSDISPTSLPRESFPTMTTGRSSGTEDVEVWFAFFDDLVPRFDSFLATLTADEIERAERFRLQRDRDQYVLARGLLREILSRSSGAHPSELRFRYGAHGKPALIAEPRDADLAFNLSHAHRSVVCAVTRDRQVGVDLEYPREGRAGIIDHQALAERFFSPHEVAVLTQLPSRSRQKAFLTCWTRKEAYIKARGDGLSLNLRSFEVFDSIDLAPRLHIESDPREAARWVLADLDVPAGYVAALAIEGDVRKVSCQQWPIGGNSTWEDAPSRGPS
jgi:4'-phosphopantetheinyl transferase